MTTRPILLLEDNPLDAEVVSLLLAEGGIDCDLRVVETRAAFEAALASATFDLILADYALSGFDGLAALAIAQAHCPDVPFVFVSGSLGEELAIGALKLGATDYVLKQRLERLVPCVQRALRESQERGDRQRSDAALLASEAKYRALFNEMDEGYCIAEVLLNDSDQPIDYRILEANPRFEQLTGLPLEVALSGRTIREIAPELEDHWYQIYGQVALTGIPARFEQQATGWNRWYEVYAHRIGPPENRQVAILFNDISDRKSAEQTLRQQIRQEYLLGDIAQEIRQSLELDQVLHSTVDRVRAWLDCDRVIIFRFRANWQGDVIMESVGDEWLAILSTTLVDPCLEARFLDPYHRGYVSVLNDIHQAGLEPCYVEFLQQFQVQASLAVPILQGTGLWGLLIAHHCAAPRQWQSAEVALLKRLSTQVGIAIQQSELYAQVRSELAERKLMQTVIEESEARFRSLSAAAPIGICQTNADGFCLYVNPRWCELSGLSYEDSLGDGWLQSVHPDDREMLSAAWFSYLEGGSEPLPDFRLLTPRGDIRWISAQAAVIKSATDDIVGYVSTYEDITARKQAEQALRESEQRLQAILDYSPAIIYMMDLENKNLLVNQSYADLLSTTTDAINGKRIHDLWPTEVADTFVAQNRVVLETGQLLQTEDIVTLADGLHKFITVKFPLWDEAGNPYAICGISTDITEKKRLEAQFYQAQRLESLGTLAGGIAHDLNNILTPILTVAQILQRTQTGLNAKGLEHLKLIETSAKRGANLVKQILSVTRASQGEPAPVDLAVLLREESEIMQQSFPKSITIQLDLPASEGSQPALGLVLADPTYLHQIVLNLCVNARDAMANGGTLTLAATTVFVDDAMAAQYLDAQVGHYAVITVADTGTGIAPEVQERMFDPFFTTKSPGQGTGLGLATVRGLVRSAQGFLQVFSEVGRGSRFKVYLPLMANPVAEATPAEPTASAALDQSEGLVLVVEDEDIVRQMLQSLLESQHYRLLLAKNGAAALEIYHQHRGDIHLVVTDVMMPVLDGLTFIQRLRTFDTELPILVLSGIPGHEDAALASGATYFLNKPFDAAAFLNQVAIALRPGC